MIFLPSPVSASQLLQESLDLGDCSFVSGEVSDELKSARRELTISCVASLDELELCEPGIYATNQPGLTLAFSTAVSERLEKIDNAVLIVPAQINNSAELCQKLEQQGTIVVAAKNPRLSFIKALVEIAAHAERSGNVLADDASVVQQGTGCIIKPGAVLGQNGFGFERDENGTPMRFPHFGKLILGDNVEVGVNSVISRGALGNTRIGDDTKIDDLVYIAHNCQIGSKVMIAGNATLCGGVEVGDKVWIGAGASIKQNVVVGEGAIVGMGAVVTRNVPAFTTVAGNPARVIGGKNKEQKTEMQKGSNACAV